MNLKRPKYKIARFLNRSRRTCWVNLVCWIEYEAPLREATNIAMCERDVSRVGNCWCGKFRSASDTEAQE